MASCTLYQRLLILKLMSAPGNQPEEDKVILLENLDAFELDLRPFFNFLVLYLFNATLALPIFIIKMALNFFGALVHNIRMRKFRNTLLTLVYYTFDISMALSVLSMYVIAFFQINLTLNYQYWAISCLIFLQSQILMSSYMQTLAVDRTELSYKFLISDENMQKMGLGRLAHQSVQKLALDVKNDLQRGFFDFVRTSMKNENIDSTLYYFALESDHGILSIEALQNLTQDRLDHYLEQAFHQLNQGFGLHHDRPQFETIEHKETILKELRIQGFRGFRHLIDNFLYPHYEYVSLMNHTNPTDLLIIVALIIILKGVYPIGAVYFYSEQQDLELFLVACFLFMYLNMVTLLIGLVVNNDLKGKRYILNVLQTMIVPNKSVDQDMDDESGDEELPLDLPYNTKFKLDLSCNLSLECWDNIRRLTLLMDMDKQEFNEATFSFLAVYLLYTYMNLSSVFLGFDLVPALHRFFKNSILEYNMVIDFALIAVLFLNRVYQGTLFNNTFKNIQESIKKIEIVYEDKKALFDFYFGNNMMENIQNPTYRRITQQIYTAAGDRVLYGLAYAGVKKIELSQYLMLAKTQSKQKVNQLCATMSKVTDQIDFDNEHFAHKMLGLFKSNIWSLLSTFGFLLYVFFHSKIKQYMNKHKIKDK